MRGVERHIASAHCKIKGFPSNCKINLLFFLKNMNRDSLSECVYFLNRIIGDNKIPSARGCGGNMEEGISVCG